MGWVSNASPEVNAESQYPTIIGVTVVMSILSIVIVCSRLYVRQTSRGLASDDWMSTLSMVFALIYSVLCIARKWIPGVTVERNMTESHLLTDETETKYGLGLSIAARPAENLITYTKVNYAGRPIYQVGISFFKIALLISYLRLLKGTDQKFYRVCVWVIMAIVFMGHLACALALVFACDPVRRPFPFPFPFPRCWLTLLPTRSINLGIR